MVEQRQHCAASPGGDPGSNFGGDVSGELAEKPALPHDLWRIALTKKLWSKPASKATGQWRERVIERAFLHRPTT
jgi:hypothetical protein